MPKTNLQIRIPEEINSQISQLSLGSKSDFVRRAIEEKIQREMFKKLEEQWIEALSHKMEDFKDANKWLKAESWGPK